MIAVIIGLLLRQKDIVTIFSTACLTVLLGIFLFGLTDASPIVLAVAVLPALISREKESGKVASVISLAVLIAVLIIAMMGTAQAI
ncbi:hypothetical protein [Thermococcus sp.]